MTSARSREDASPPARRIPRWAVVALGLLAWLVGVPLVHGALPWALSTLTHRHGWAAGGPGIWNVLGVIPIAIGVAVLVWDLASGLARLGEVPKRVAGLAPPFLMTRGPYAYTRNPMYVAELALWLGWAIFFGSASVLLGGTLLAAGIAAVVPREERTLEARFGDAYREYKRSVPRWLGRRR